MAGLAAIGGIVSGIASAAGSMMSASASASAKEDQAAIKDAEAQNQLRKGLEENAVKQRDAANQTRERDKVLSDQRAKFAASGGGIGGSAKFVQEQTALQGTQNANVSLWEGAQLQQNREFQAKQLAVEAQSLRKAAQNERTAGVISGISGVAGGFGGAFKGGGSSGGGGGSYYYGSSGPSYG